MNYVPAYSSTYEARERNLLAVAARYPGCTDWPPEEALLISTLVLTLEEKDPTYVAWVIRKCGLTIPPKILRDRFRLIKHLFAQWHDPEVRERILSKVLVVKRRQLLQELTILTPHLANRELRRASPTFLLGPMLAMGLKEDVTALVSMLDAEGLAYYRGDVLLGQILCHRLWREKEPSTLPLRERRRLMHRLRRRTYHMRQLHRSIYQLDRERKALLRLSWESEQAARATLDEFIQTQERIESEIAEAIRSHARRLTTLQSDQAEELQALRSRLEARRSVLAEALAERRLWNRPLPLAGQTVLIVGNLKHEAAYHAVVTELGGRPIVLDGVEQRNRIREVAPEADVAILISAAIKHSAAAALTAAVRPHCLVLYCPQTGRASLERMLRTEVLPRQASLSVASSQEGGGVHGR